MGLDWASGSFAVDEIGLPSDELMTTPLMQTKSVPEWSSASSSSSLPEPSLPGPAPPKEAATPAGCFSLPAGFLLAGSTAPSNASPSVVTVAAWARFFARPFFSSMSSPFDAFSPSSSAFRPFCGAAHSDIWKTSGGAAPVEGARCAFSALAIIFRMSETFLSRTIAVLPRSGAWYNADSGLGRNVPPASCSCVSAVLIQRRSAWMKGSRSSLFPSFFLKASTEPRLMLQDRSSVASNFSTAVCDTGACVHAVAGSAAAAAPGVGS